MIEWTKVSTPGAGDTDQSPPPANNKGKRAAADIPPPASPKPKTQSNRDAVSRRLAAIL